MDDRQRQIREGAGLEESRLNTEFIDFLKKYSTPLLLVIAVVAGGYFLWNKVALAREQGRDSAFVEFDGAKDAKNPTGLLRVAEENAGRGAVSHLARLLAADLHLEAYRTGIPAGVSFTPQGTLPEGQELLKDDQRQAELALASDLYNRVVKDAESDGYELPMLAALNGVASVAESRGQIDEARAAYTKVLTRAKADGYAEMAAATQKRLDTLDALKTMPRAYAQAELPVSAPAPGESKMVKVRSVDGKTLELAPDETNPDRLVPAEAPIKPGTVPPLLAKPKTEPTPVTPAPTTPAPTTPTTPNPNDPR